MTSIDKIVKNYLLQKGYPMHFYLQCLTYAANCLRTLAMDDLHIVNSVLLKLDDAATAKLPDGYIDYTRIGVQVGQFIKPLVENDSYNNLPNRNDDGNIIPYGDKEAPSYSYSWVMDSPYWMTVPYNDLGELTGRMYGMPQTQIDTYKVIPERGVIQFNEKLCAKNIVLEYLSSCGYSNAATCLTEYAFETISTYIAWQLKEHNRNYSIGERMEAREMYYNERRILRARLNPLGAPEVAKIINNARVASIK